MATLVNDGVVAYFIVVAAAVTIVTTSALLVSRCFIRHPAIRHCILLVALLAALTSPLIACLFMAADAPLLQIPLWSSHAELSNAATTVPSRPASESEQEFVSEGSTPTQESSIAEVPKANPNVEPVAGPQGFRVNIALIIPWAWAIGALCMALQFLLRLHCVRRLRQSCRPSTGPLLHKSLQEVGQRLGIKHLPELAISGELRVPVVIGLLDPVVVFPESSLATTDRTVLRDVLVHELAHVIRRDHLVLFLEAVSRVTLWAIPPVHSLIRSLAIAREEVCDNYVRRDRDAVNYCETLLRLGELVHGTTPNGPTVGFISRRGSLEDRVSRLLDERRSRMTRPSRLAVSVVIAGFMVGNATLCRTTIVASPNPSDSAKQASERKTNVAVEDILAAWRERETTAQTVRLMWTERRVAVRRPEEDPFGSAPEDANWKQFGHQYQQELTLAGSVR